MADPSVPEIPVHEQKRQLLEKIVADANRAHDLDERESMTVMTLDEATEYWDRLVPHVKDLQVVAAAIEAECYIRRSERIAREPSQQGRRTDLELVTPGVRGSSVERKERSHMRAVGKQSATARQYVETEVKANRRATKKGIVRHVKKVAAPKAAPKPAHHLDDLGLTGRRSGQTTYLEVVPISTPTRDTTAAKHGHILAMLEKVADGQRRTDPQLERVVGNVLNYLKYVYLIQWLTIDRTSAGTVFTIDQELRAICEKRAPRPDLQGWTVREFLTRLRVEITRRRKENNDLYLARAWKVHLINAKAQSNLLDWIEEQLDRIP